MADRAPTSEPMSRLSQLGRISPWWWVASTMLLLVALTPLDRSIYFALRDPDIDGSDTYQLFRAFGHLPTWILFAAGLFALERRDPALSKDDRVLAAASFVIAPALAGAGAELVKLLSGRMRPEVGDGLYTFKPLFGGFVDGSNLGFASSHAAVAMGGALIVAYRFPRLAYVLVPVALGCGLSRMLGGAHYATDVVAGFGIAALVAYWLRGVAIKGPQSRVTNPR
jgi:membrane-associated phospholipid phosphatase